MPNCGTQAYLCDLPIRFDTYRGCSHACKYCFTRHKLNILEISKFESPRALKNFINGKRNNETNWCDWDIPLHWGGMSDPFQPCEEKYKNSYECLKVFADTGYPFVVSTKGKIIGDTEYLSLIKECNGVVQISMVCDKYDILELGCPSFEERLKILENVSNVAKRTIVRIQPYMLEIFDDVYKNLSKFKDAGAYGVIIEGLKLKKQTGNLEKLGGDFVYKYGDLKRDFLKLKERCHNIGLKIYAGENRLRRFGDSLTCCGVDNLKDFKPNRFNLNHLLNGEKVFPKAQQKNKGTARCFTALRQSTAFGKTVSKYSFSEMMFYYYKSSKDKIYKILGVENCQK